MTEKAAGNSQAAQTDGDDGSSSLPNQSGTSTEGTADETADSTPDGADDNVSDKASDEADDAQDNGSVKSPTPQPSEPVVAPAAAFATGQGRGGAPERPSQRERLKAAGSTVKKGTDAIRNRIASIVWLIAVLCAVVLALGALLYSLDANPDNSLVQWVNDTAKKLDGPFADVFSFEGKDARTKERLVNWGLAALAYLIAGRVADRIIRA